MPPQRRTADLRPSPFSLCIDTASLTHERLEPVLLNDFNMLWMKLRIKDNFVLEPSDNKAQQSTPQAATEIYTVALNRDFESTNSWVAHASVCGRVTHMVDS